MNELTIFDNEEFGSIRTITIDNEPWFVGKDVAGILGYTNASKAISDHVESEDKLNNESLSSLGQRGGWLINESGLYSLVLSSKLPTAKKFKKWVTSEVLPSIRKHGIYATDNVIEQVLNNPEFGIKLLTELKEEREKNKVLAEQNTEMKPKAIFADAVSTSNTSILIGDLAKLICQNGVQIGQKRLFQWMRDNGWLMKSGSSVNLPTQRGMERKFFEIKETTSVNPDGSVRTNRTTKVTGRGQVYFINCFLNKDLEGKQEVMKFE